MRLSKIRMIDEQGNDIFKGSCMHLPFKNECIIQKSIEMFNDPEPCIINRTAAINFLGIDITQLFFEESNQSGSKILLEWSKISDRVEQMISPVCVPKIIEVEFI